MKINSTSALGRTWRRYCKSAKVLALLFIILSVSTGHNVEETKLSSSQQQQQQQQQQGKDNIRIQISESLKDTRTVDQKTQNVIPTTEMLIDSSYISEAAKKEIPTSRNVEENSKKNKEIEDETKVVDSSRKYFDFIQPTKAISVEEPKIMHTYINKGSGEAKGVSMKKQMNISRPQKSSEMNYNRIKRGFGSPSEIQNEEVKVKTGKSYNQIEQSLGKIAKITVNDEHNQSVQPTATPFNFRESREEENRKASPDIQDIITGLVNILNSKATKQHEGKPVRPSRPTSTRINNRGPPRISDVPPLDFDGPPGYRPLPPPPPLPPKRIPPPYPFDLPVSMPNIPLPPQPPKPGSSKLPSHPFLSGVPIPELIVPDEHYGKPLSNRPPIDHIQEYDTISMSEPVDSQTHTLVPFNATQKPDAYQPVHKNVTKNENVKYAYNNTNVISTSTSTTSKPDYNKSKTNGQKVSSANKNNNKRVRPGQVNRPSEKPITEEVTTTQAPVVKEEVKKNTESWKVENAMPEKTTKTTTTAEKAASEVPTTTVELPNKEETGNANIEIVDGPFQPTTNVSAFLNLAPTSEAPETKSTTSSEVSIATTTTTTQAQKEVSKHIEVHKGTEKYEIDLELPVLLEPSLGVGEATPVLESSILELSLLPTEQTKTATTPLATQRPTPPIQTETTKYKARPGIVLDDPEYKPGHKRPVISTRPIITAPPPHSGGHYGEIFDVTVHAVQGPGGEESSTGKPFIVPAEAEGVHIQNPQLIKGDVSVITKPEDGQNFVSIDGKRTYINLFGEATSTKISPTTTQAPVTGTGYVIPHKEPQALPPSPNRPPVSASPPRRPYKRPNHPPVRIDTCIVGDDTTCDSAQNEMCRTEDGVSSCLCRPGYNRRKHRDTCRRVVSMLTSLRVDRLYDRKMKWQDNLRDPDSEEYQQLSYEASQAIESAMSMTPFSDDFINSRINSIYTARNLENNEPAVYVNVTIQLEENLDTIRPAVKHEIQKHLLSVIQRRNNNVGNSAVWVDAPPGSILALQDVDECSSSELHDCHERAICLNTFGSFKCQCPNGLRDPWVGNIHREGRFCEMCPSDYCNNRGECQFEHGQQVCHCSGNFYGTQCEIDGEVLGVAIGASVAAAIIIILTLVCLCMWSRRWSREQKSAVGAGMGSPVFGYMATGPTVKTPSVGGPPYQVSIEDRIRWAQIADVMAKSNHYAQPEPVNGNTRTSYGGYPTLPSHGMNMPGTLPLPTITPPVPLPRLTLSKPPMGTYGAHSQLGSVHQSTHGIRSSLETTSSSEEEDRADLLGRNFNAPRPKSRTSVANQSGIYYDVDFDRSDAYSKQNTIPMNTYTLNPQHQVRPYFR